MGEKADDYIDTYRWRYDKKGFSLGLRNDIQNKIINVDDQLVDERIDFHIALIEMLKEINVNLMRLAENND